MFKILEFLTVIVTAIATLFTPARVAGPVVPLTPPSSPTVVNPNPIAQAESTLDITVMSYNVYINGNNLRAPDVRADYVAQTITKYAPDSFGVQEADKKWTDRLEFRLPEYGRVGTYRDDGIEAGESSSIFYLKDKYTVIETGNFWLSETPDVPSMGWDAACPRLCTYALLEDIETGFRYAHFNLHTDHVGTQARAESVKLITQKIGQLYPDVPVVVTGDFNTDEGSDDYNTLCNSGLIDTKQVASLTDNGPTYHGYSLITGSKPIDFIFVNGYASSVKSYTIDKTLYCLQYSSDHHPIIAEITLFNGGVK